MSSEQHHLDCAVIGAGMSGLVAADQLMRTGASVAVLEKSPVVGGRMAAFRYDADEWQRPASTAVFDHGAQYFTVRDDQFESLVRHWQEMGIVHEWSQGFATSDGSLYTDGTARFCGIPDMSSIPAFLAQKLDLRLRAHVLRVEWQSSFWQITTEDQRIITADALILTPPVPISLGILDAGGIAVPTKQRAMLDRIEYEPCMAVMVLLQGAGNIPQPGGIWSLGEPVAWIADNYLKGVSPVRGAITIHAGPDFSEEYWHSTDEDIIRELVASSGEWLDSQVTSAWVKRWPYSKPFMTYPESCLMIKVPGPLLFAGDAFAGPRVEGAALSGLAAASMLTAAASTLTAAKITGC